MNKIQTLRNQVEQLKGEKVQIERSIKRIRELIKEHRISERYYEQALEIVKTVGLKTQQQLQYHIGDITTLALDAVFPDPYELVAEFVERRNKTECDLYFHRGGNKTNPIDASGGGAVDVAAFALRIASWSMKYPRTRNVIILDEPMRFLSSDLQYKASLMLKEISEKLKIQFIIITHEEELTEAADRVFRISIHQGKSKIQVEK